MNRQTKRIYEFGPYRLDAAERLLLRDGEVVPLQPKVFDLLLALLERHGRLVEKDELMNAVWPDTIVEEANLANNISILRKTLSENGERFIETAPKRGYRFVASVKKLEEDGAEQTVQEPPGLRSHTGGSASAADDAYVATTPTSKTESLARGGKHHKWGAMLALTILIAAGAGFLFFFLRQPLPPKVLSYVSVTRDGLPKTRGSMGSYWISSLVSDGSRVYFNERTGVRTGIAQVSSTGGETVAVSAPFNTGIVWDGSPSRSELLVAGYYGLEDEAPLWALPVLGGAPRRLGNLLGHSGAWSLDGQQVVYANGSSLCLAKSDGTEYRKLVTVSGKPYWPRWSPDGSRLRFTVRDTKTGSYSLWEVSANGDNPHPLLSGWNTQAAECCGNWTQDGRYFVFQSTHNRSTHIWVMRERTGLFQRDSQEPVQLTSGPLNYYAPAPSQDGKKLFVVGEQGRGELARYDTKSQQWGNYLSGISAEQLDFSRDGEWVVYVTYPEASLWRSKMDGRERLQLTNPPMEASLPRWSPDGKQIALSARAPGKPWKTYLIPADGGTLRQLTPEERTELDPGWSADGKTLVFGNLEAKTLQLFDLRTGQVSTLPDSEGMYAPRWSPDGRYIAAIPAEARDKLRLFDFTTQKWTVLAQQQALWPRWSGDGKYIYFSSAKDNDMSRVRIVDRKIERLASLKDFRMASGVFGAWVGWTPDDQPLMLRDVGTQDIYALEWQTP
jgi:Tol biopolymer transport system component/DNA-binding winged helix-turn-helix (wHTH) protein